MRKIFSLLMATLFCVVLWAQAPAGTTLFSENFGGYAANDVPSGSVSSVEGSRVVYGGGSVTYTSVDNGKNITKIYADALASGTSPELLVGKSGGVFTVAGIPSGNAQEITVSFKQNAQKLTVSLAGTGYSTEYASPKPSAAGEVTFDVTVADGADATFSLIMTAGSSNVRVDDILVTVKTAGESSGGDDPQPAGPEYYLVGSMNNWQAAEAYKFAAAETEGEYLLHTTLAAGDEIKVIKVDGETTTWYPAVGDNYVVDATHAGEKDIYFRPAGNEAWAAFGGYIWMGENQPAPVEAAYYLVGSMNNWQAAEAYKFAAAETEGEYLLHTTLAVDDEIKVIKVEGETTTWYPAEGDNYVVDAAHAGEKDIYFRPAGNEAWAEFGGYIWMGENQPAPVADFTQPFTLKFNGTGESSKDASAAFAADVAAIFDAASAPYVASVETATKIYAGRPIADDNSSVKFGTTSAQGSLSFTLVQAIEVDSIIVNATQYGTNAAKITVNGTEFDLTAGNKVPQDSKITPEGAISVITIAQSGSERIYLRNVRVYPKTQGGDTPVEIVLPVVKLAGSLTSWSEPALMVNAEDSLSATLTLNLGIDHYQLKVVSDDNWLTRAGEGDLFTMHRDYPHVDHLNLVNTGDNIQLITDVEGAYTFTWTYADSSLVVTFPEAPAQPKYYIIGGEDIVGEGKYDWNLENALPSYDREYVLNLAAGFHKFKVVTIDSQWKGIEALTDTAAGIYTDADGNICFDLAEAGAVTVVYDENEFTVSGNFAIVQHPQYYVVGDEDIVGPGHATWSKEGGLVSYGDTLELNLAAGEHLLKVVTPTDAWLGFEALTDTAAGLYPVDDLFGGWNIGFTLEEAAVVKVIYNGEIFKLIGNFYVAPAPDPTVSVFGTMTNPAWEVEVPFVLSADETYASLTVNNIDAGEYNFKFYVNGEWRSNGYRYHRDFPGAAGITGNADADMTFVADQEGEYTFYWYFANDSAAIVYPELPFQCNWEELPFLGDGSPEQTHGNQFKLCKEGQYPGVVNVQKPGFADESGIYVTFPSAAFGEISLPAGKYAIQGAGMILYCSAFDAQQETEVTVVCDNNPIVFTIYNANYTPAPPTGNIRLVPGVWNLDNAKFAAVTWHVGEAFENGTVSAWFEYLNADTLIGNVPNDADSIAFARFNSAAEAPSMDMSMIWNHTDKLLIDKQTMIYTISGWPEEGRDFCPGYWGEYIEPVYTLTNGYYLVGKFGGVDAWSVDDLSAKKLFAQNPDNADEYQLPINLAENDEIKVVYVENDEIVTWYPKEGENYVVDHNHAGATMMYFQPTYKEDWAAFGGYFYIAPTDHVDITNTAVDAQAVKAIRNGQLIIIKGEKTYNAQGILVK